MKPGLIATLACALAIASCARAAAGPDGSAAGAAFLAQNASAEGVRVTPSGLQYRVLHAGPAGGATPKLSDQVKVNYEGKLLDGEVFDSSYARGEPAVFAVDAIIPAWREALQLMRPGDEWLVYAPPSLAYGADGAGPIPPGSVLVFKIALIDILPVAAP